MAKGENYEEFVEKFKPKKTTDDCYTPPLVKAEREKAEREKAERWTLSEREKEIIENLGRKSK